MSDSLERLLEDLRFDVPAGLVERAKAAAELHATGTAKAGRGTRRLAARRAITDRGDHALQRQQWVLALVAALLAITIVSTLVGVRLLHNSTPSPGRHGSPAGLHHNGRIVVGIGNSLFAIAPDAPVLRGLEPNGHVILLAETDVAVSDAAYSSDGSRLAYVKTPGYGKTKPAVWVLNTTTGRNDLLTTCTAPGCGRFSHLSWSPDGSRLAFSDSDALGELQLFLIDADGTHRTQLTHFSSGQHATQPSWSPDGTRIAFTLSTGPFGQRLNCEYSCGTLAPPSSIEVIKTDGSGLTVLLSDVRQQDGAGDLDPTWSPDGSRIAYSIHVPAVGGPPPITEYQLWLMDTDGSHRTKIYATQAEPGQHEPGGPAWSPDGKRIALVTLAPPCRGGTCAYELFVIDTDGSHSRDLGNVGYGDRPAWQPVP